MDESGAGLARPPTGPGFRERFELASAGVPFRIKLAIVWLLIATVAGVLFWAVEFDIPWMEENFSFILLGLPWTMLICISAIVLATIMALVGALSRISRNPVLYGISGFYTSFFRGTPLIVQLFLAYAALPEIGQRLASAGYPQFVGITTLDAIPTGIIVLGLNYGAYMTEIFRAGIQSVGHGQGEAAYALGMTYRKVMRRVVLPQATRVIIPPTGNEFIAMLKDSALVSVLGTTPPAIELFRRAQLVGSFAFRNLEAYVLAAAIYWALTSVFTFFQARLERRMSKGYVRQVETRRRWRPGGAPGTGGTGATQTAPSEEIEGGAGPPP